MEARRPGLVPALRASAVETLLARLSGEVAPLWISVGAVLDRQLDPDRLRLAMRQLVAATPRLQLAWHEPGARWRQVVRDDATLDAALSVDHTPADMDTICAEALSGDIDLSRDLPLRLHLRALRGGAGPYVLVSQLHHAVGDARALARLGPRLFQLYNAPGSLTSWGGPASSLPDAQLARVLATSLPRWIGALRPASLLFFPRGASLRRAHPAQTIGAPMLAHRAVTLDAPPRKYGALITAAIAATCAAQIDGDALRLRLPVDLSAQLGLRDVLANTCIAIPVELSAHAVRAASDDARALVALTQGALGAAIARGGPLVTLLECLLTARLTSASTLRRGARPGLLASPRTNTLVTTHVGALDKTFADMPAQIVDAWGHTPTWGVNSWSLSQTLHINATCFEGLWTTQELETFADALAAKVRWLDAELYS